MLTEAKGRMALLVLVVAAVLAVVLGGSVVTAQGPADIRSVVIFDEGTFGTQAADHALKAVGAAPIKTIDRARMAVVYLPSQAAMARLSGQRGVVRVERDIVVHATGSAAGGAPAVLKKPPWAGGPSKDGGSDTPPQELPWGVERIGADPTSNRDGESTGGGINVAVLDTGIDLDHPDLMANVEGEYMALAEVGRYRKHRAPDDDNGHGTHVAGIIAAEDNTQGVVGVAPDANLYAVKVLDQNGSGYFSDVIDGIYWAIDTHDPTVSPSGNDDIHIINMSLGADEGSVDLSVAVSAAEDAGILIVAAAGNDGKAVDYPAAYPGVIAVAATNDQDTAPSWSSRGDGKGDDEVELAAPGVAVYSTYKDGSYETLSGTSMASPHVAGSAALVWAANSGWDATDVRTALIVRAEGLGDAKVYGHGLVQPWEAAQ